MQIFHLNYLLILPCAWGRRGKREKKIGNLQDLSRTKGRPTSDDIQGNLSGTSNAGIQPTRINEVHVTRMLNQFFWGYSFSKPFIAFLLALQESSSDNEKEPQQTKNEMVVFVPPFLLLALFYCQERRHFMLFKEPSKRAHRKCKCN